MMEKVWGLVGKILHFVIYRVIKIDMSTNTYENIVQFVKFGLVGITNNLVYYVVYLIFIRIGMHYIPSNIIAFTVSVFNAYYWNNKYVFICDGRRTWWKTFFKTYIAYAGTGIVLGNLLMLLWVEVLGISEVIAPLLSLVITIPLNFFINKFWSFRGGQ